MEEEEGEGGLRREGILDGEVGEVEGEVEGGGAREGGGVVEEGVGVVEEGVGRERRFGEGFLSRGGCSFSVGGTWRMREVVGSVVGVVVLVVEEEDCCWVREEIWSSCWSCWSCCWSCCCWSCCCWSCWSCW